MDPEAANETASRLVGTCERLVRARAWQLASARLALSAPPSLTASLMRYELVVPPGESDSCARGQGPTRASSPPCCECPCDAPSKDVAWAPLWLRPSNRSPWAIGNPYSGVTEHCLSE
jgi:hypothetical protein